MRSPNAFCVSHHFHSLNKVFEKFFGDVEPSLIGSNSAPSCETMKNDENSGDIVIGNPLYECGVLGKTKIPDQCSTQKKAKMSLVEILEDVRIQPSADSSFALEQFNNFSLEINSNQTIRGQSPERFQEIIKEFRARASPILKKANDQCEICRKKTGESFLIYHRRIHLIEYPIHCRLCFEIFFKYTEKDLHEENCQKLRYECYRCRKTLPYYAALEQHMQRH